MPPCADEHLMIARLAVVIVLFGVGLLLGAAPHFAIARPGLLALFPRGLLLGTRRVTLPRRADAAAGPADYRTTALRTVLDEGPLPEAVPVWPRARMLRIANQNAWLVRHPTRLPILVRLVVVGEEVELTARHLNHWLSFAICTLAFGVLAAPLFPAPWELVAFGAVNGLGAIAASLGGLIEDRPLVEAAFDQIASRIADGGRPRGQRRATSRRRADRAPPPWIAWGPSTGPAAVPPEQRFAMSRGQRQWPA